MGYLSYKSNIFPIHSRCETYSLTLEDSTIRHKKIVRIREMQQVLNSYYMHKCNKSPLFDFWRKINELGT
jgi:hypothetical protein